MEKGVCEISKNTFFTEPLWTTASVQKQPPGVFSKNVFLKIPHVSQENICVGVSL